MKWDFRHHLLLQIEMLRADISHEEFSKRLGDVTERSLARYIAGKSHLTEAEFGEIAKALKIDAAVLAHAWATSLGLRVSEKDAVCKMVNRAYRRWQQFSRVAARAVLSHPSPMAVIRARYADSLPICRLGKSEFVAVSARNERGNSWSMQLMLGLGASGSICRASWFLSRMRPN
jgi:hypothetical protein